MMYAYIYKKKQKKKTKHVRISMNYTKIQKVITLFILSILLIYTGSIICNMYARITYIDDRLKTYTDKSEISTYTYHVMSGAFSIIIGVVVFIFTIYYLSKNWTMKEKQVK